MKFWQTPSFRRAAALGFFGLIILGSSVPGRHMPSVFKLTPDKLLHGAEYTLFGILLVRWLRVALPGLSEMGLCGMVLLSGGLAAALDENYQRLIPNRTPDIRDWFVDLAGLLTGCVVYLVLKRRLKN